MLKKKIHQSCLIMLQEKIQQTELEMHELVSGASNDSKSTAGDKHETARAMMQREQENLGKQLNDLRQQKTTFERIPTETNLNFVSQGSLIKTSRGYFYLALALGKIHIDELDIFVLSSHSPLGQKLLGCKKQDSVSINQSTYVIEEIL